MAAKIKQPAGALQLKITLRGSKPPIWRRIIVPEDCGLEILHYVIQAAMGWTDSHLHSFKFGDRDFTGRNPYGEKMTDPFGDSGLDAGAYRLSDLVTQPKAKFMYEYDFGDSWEHVILVEKFLPPLGRSGNTFQCLAGKGACPPEDCGGIWGYYRLLEILGNPTHEEHAEMKEWAGPIDPDAFDLDGVNRILARIKA